MLPARRCLYGVSALQPLDIDYACRAFISDAHAIRVARYATLFIFDFACCRFRCYYADALC